MPATPVDRLSRLIRPRHIAVFGSTFAERVIAQCRKAGFDGEIWPVHPQRPSIGGLPVYRSVAELPAAPDASFIGVNRHATVEVVDALAQRGACGAVCYASGFAETDAEGEALQRRLIAAAGDMAVLGPNCYGFINYLDGALLWPDQHGGRPVERGVAVIAQSSNIAVNITMNRRALPLAYILCVGNQAAVGIAELVEALTVDPRVSAIGLHIEGLRETDRFARAVQQARAAGKPVIALAMGQSEAGRALALTHTASLAGGAKAMAAFLDRLGVARVSGLTTFLETLKLLHTLGPLDGRDVVSLSCSGGEAGLAADTALAAGVHFRPFSATDQERIRPTLNPLVTLSNPFDYHTFDWANPERLEATYSAVMDSRFDLAMLIMDFPREDRCVTTDWDVTLGAWVRSAERTGAPAAVVATLPELLPETVAWSLLESGVVPLMGLDEALAAADAAATVGRPMVPYHPWPVTALPGQQTEVIGEFAAKHRLALFGIPVPDGGLCTSLDELDRVLSTLRYPVVAKASGAALAHKSELGGVRLHLRDAAAVREAYRALRPLGEAVLVESMVDDGVAELILGLNRDPVIGLTLVVGFGGVLTEILQDSRVLVLPATPEAVREAICSLRGAALLTGYRGKPAADLDAVVEAAMGLQRFAEANRDALIEVDINPLIVRPQGKGAVAVDGLIRWRC